MAGKITGALNARIKDIPLVDVSIETDVGTYTDYEGVIENFALLVDTHRDQPHIGSFHHDIHRGQSRPTMVHYSPADDTLIEASTGQVMARHDKHMYITEEWFTGWLVERMINGDSDPRDPDGIMATSHLRDARAKVYQLKSFRQIVMERWAEARAGSPIKT